MHDYFKGEKRAALASPDGAHLTGDIVNALTGTCNMPRPGAPDAGKVIGHVTKLAGSATAIRNGVSIILNMGDNVEKGDVVQSGSDSTLGVTFIDGTVFGLSSNARMVLNEMVYDPNGSNNSSLISLVAGTISFVAGETAKHGDMKIDTPVATMGIRGTAVLVEIDFTFRRQGSTPDAKFQVLVEPDGTTGSYILYDKTTLRRSSRWSIRPGSRSRSATAISHTNDSAVAGCAEAHQRRVHAEIHRPVEPASDDHYRPERYITPASQGLGLFKIVDGIGIIPTTFPRQWRQADQDRRRQRPLRSCMLTFRPP